MLHFSNIGPADFLRHLARLINDAHHLEQGSDSVKGECPFARRQTDRA